MNETRLNGLRMKRDTLSHWILRHVGKLPFSAHAMRWAISREGGYLTSTSYREYLREERDVHVGDFSYGSLLLPGQSDRGLTIGRYVSIGPNVRRFGAAHPVDRLTMHPYWYNPALGLVDQQADVPRGNCVISDEAWIGANVVILPGCSRIGIGAVVGAGSVVTKDVPDFAIALGAPAVIKKYRFTDALQNRLLEEAPWDLEPKEAARAYARIAEEEGDPNLFVPTSRR